MTIAVLGAGLTGSLVALELAAAGQDVVLFDRQAVPFAGASLSCEGKIHMGYVYALDRSLRTARTMLDGAASFRPLIERWTGQAVFDRHLSEPFIYAVPKDSLMTVEEIRTHFDAVSRAARSLDTPWPLGPEETAWSEMPPDHLAAIFDPSEILAAFETGERAIDTTALGHALREALSAAPRLRLEMEAQITGVRDADGVLEVSGSRVDHPFAERFDIVVNALWEHRVHIDATFGLPVSRSLIHRYKCGLFAGATTSGKAMPNVTFLIGSYGDTVRYADSAYLSWYPAGLVSQEVAIRPATQDIRLSEEERRRLVADTLGNLRRLMPGGMDGVAEDPSDWEIRGGFITAWGRTGIEDAASELHERYDIGVFSSGNYHSIDTGKLTLAPLFAAEACRRILGTYTGGP
jgi:glycine/D-amino acid oxidase-like deaminating enzyme